MVEVARETMLAGVILVGGETWEMGALEECSMQRAAISAQKKRAEPALLLLKAAQGEV